MRVYVDVFSSDELLCDSFPVASAYNEAVLTVPSSWIARDNSGIGSSIDVQDIEDRSERVINLVYMFGLKEIEYSKLEYAVYLHRLQNYLAANCPARVDGFLSGVSDFTEYVMSRFADFSFYRGESGDSTAMAVLACYLQDTDVSPVFYFFADGLCSQQY